MSLAMAILTEQTCGFSCWMAEQDICRCSCGGKNHGCLTTKDGTQPIRTAKIDGDRYELKAIGKRSDIYAESSAILKAAGPRSVDRGYTYHWHDTDHGAPCRVKYPTKDQVKRWEELTAWRGPDGKPTRDFYRDGIVFLWVKMPPITIQHPDAPAEKFDNIIDAIEELAPEIAPIYCEVCGEVKTACACRPSIDYTESGAQYMIPDAPTRRVPDTPLRAKKAQTTKPTVLEMYEEEIKQPKLF